MTAAVSGSLGCARESNLDIIVQRPAVSLDENLKRAKAYCKSSDPGQCHPSVGFVLTVTTDGTFSTVGQCTGFLVAADIVATNSHCIPDELKARPAICSKTIGIKFPASGAHAEEIAVCGELLKFSEITDDRQNPDFLRKADYALFRIAKPSSRPGVAIARSGIEDGTSLTVMAVDPIAGSNYAEGRLTAKRCQAVKGSSHMPEDTHPLSTVSIVFGPECNARQGNSGSPALLADGRAAGILHGGVPPGSTVGAHIPRDKVVSHFENPAHITNLACVAIPAAVSGAPTIPGSCDAENIKKLAQHKTDDLSRALTRKLVVSAQESYAQWAIQHAPRTFKYKATLKISRTSLAMDFEIAPTCVTPEWSWTRTKVARHVAAATIDLPKFSVKTKLDPYMRLVHAVERADAGGAARIVTFDVSQLSVDPKHLGSIRSTPASTEETFVSRKCTSAETITDEPLIVDIRN